ncbi:MAG: FAD-binding domain [Acidobacteria bacterium]|nr:FAD-binding domain [Acidobacteriota bacterium]
MKILISGAGVAGPAAAFWLTRSGHEVVMVERSNELRSGGYVIDFWGLGYDIAEKMGLLAQIRGSGYQVKEVRFVNENGKRRGGFSTDIFTKMTGGRFTSVQRSEVSAAIFNALDDKTTCIFGDSITSLADDGEGVNVEFENASPGRFDLVLGADGLHSKVRELTFGAETQFEKPLGYYVAAINIEGYPHRDELVYVSHAVRGRQVSRFSMRGDRTLFLFVFRDEYLHGSMPKTAEQQRTALRSIFAAGGWECSEILTRLDEVDDIYFDRVSQIRMPSWTRGRIGLIGDSAACVSLLAGEGTGLAITEAYVLAGELLRSNNDHKAAFAAYQERLMPFLSTKQNSAAAFASSFVPKSSLGITFRNIITRLMSIRPVAEYFVGRDLRDHLKLPDYGLGKHIGEKAHAAKSAAN